MTDAARILEVAAVVYGADRRRWEVRHQCGGVRRRINLAGHILSCLDCGEAIAMYSEPDTGTGHVVVMDDDGLTAQDET